jgi:EAL domain-containing protein (putative c-di-GMP-specific phosphodiesterase class I)
MSHADNALAEAKKTPGSARRWTPGRDATSKEQLALSAELRAGIANDEIVLHFQPQIDLRTGAVGCAEALARWQHPVRGLLGPGEFVPVAERTGLIREFTTAVLNLAIREASHWRTLGLGGGEVAVAVNLSARNLLDRELPADVAVILARHGLPARQLVLEITETVMMSELEVVEDVVGRLRALGVQVSVDDFGTGYSSLKFLQKIQVNEVKIDQSFVQKMMEHDGDAAIVRATVELAHGLGLRVCAEGVEDQDVVEALSALGCDAAQGFHLARPMPSEVMREMLMPSSGIVVPLHKARRQRGLA